MVTIWTLSNPLQCMASPEKSINNSGRDFFIDDVPKYWLGKISIDYLCQQWFRKLIVSYLHQYQTFPVKTARSEYTMALYYQTLSIVPYFSTFVPGNLYINGKESKKLERVVLNDYQASYQDLLNVVHRPTLFMCCIWKPVLLKCLDAWMALISQVKN